MVRFDYIKYSVYCRRVHGGMFGRLVGKRDVLFYWRISAHNFLSVRTISNNGMHGSLDWVEEICTP